MLERYRTRELRVIGCDWERTLMVNRQTLAILFEQVDHVQLSALHRGLDPDESFDILAGEDVVSLWLGTNRLAVIRAPRHPQ